MVVFFPQLFEDDEYPEMPMFRSFGTYDEAKLYFEWQRIIGQERAALYDSSLKRIEQGILEDSTFGFFMFDQFTRQLPEDAWEPVEIDPDAPYLVGSWFDEPIGNVLADLEEAWDEYQANEEPVFLYNIHGEQLAFKGHLTEYEMAKFEIWANQALTPFAKVQLPVQPIAPVLIERPQKPIVTVPVPVIAAPQPMATIIEEPVFKAPIVVAPVIEEPIFVPEPVLYEEEEEEELEEEYFVPEPIIEEELEPMPEYFYVMFENSGCRDHEEDVVTEFKAFEDRLDAERFFRWHSLKKSGVALYDYDRVRLNFASECSYRPAYFDHLFADFPLNVEPTYLDVDAPYFFAFSFNGKPGGRVVLNEEEAWKLVEDQYWQDSFSLRLYNRDLDLFAERGLPLEESIYEHRLERLAKRELTPYLADNVIAPKEHKPPFLAGERSAKSSFKPAKKAKITKKKAAKVEQKKAEPAKKTVKKQKKVVEKAEKKIDAYIEKKTKKADTPIATQVTDDIDNEV